MSEVSPIAPYDFHVHSSVSHDGSGTVMEYCERAVERHMRAIGFCEHVDLDERDITSGHHDYEAYRSAVDEARARFDGELQVRMGAEVGFIPRIKDDIRAFLKERDYDCVVGSVHTIADGMAGVSEEYEALETFARHELMDAYHEYFDTVRQMVVTGLFDVVGHLDLIQRYGVKYLTGPLEWGQFYGVLRRIFEGVVKRQMAVEINSSGLRQNPESTYPPRQLLQLYREVDGEAVILGSDAHQPGDLGSGIPAAARLARELGLAHVSFKGRLIEPLPWQGPPLQSDD